MESANLVEWHHLYFFCEKSLLLRLLGWVVGDSEVEYVKYDDREPRFAELKLMLMLVEVDSSSNMLLKREHVPRCMVGCIQMELRCSSGLNPSVRCDPHICIAGDMQQPSYLLELEEFEGRLGLELRSRQVGGEVECARSQRLSVYRCRIQNVPKAKENREGPVLLKFDTWRRLRVIIVRTINIVLDNGGGWPWEGNLRNSIRVLRSARSSTQPRSSELPALLLPESALVVLCWGEVHLG